MAEKDYLTLDVLLDVPHTIAGLRWAVTVVKLCENHKGEVKIKREYDDSDLPHGSVESYPETYDCKNCLEMMQMLGEASARRKTPTNNNEYIIPAVRLMVEGRDKKADELAGKLYGRLHFDDKYDTYIMDGEGKFHYRE